MADDYYKVLSLEDSDPDFELIRENLSMAGFRISFDRAVSKQEYIELLSGNSYDLILSDFQLAEFNGFDALNSSRKICPDVPFICVSGYIGEETAIELLKQGAVDYVLKDKPDKLPLAFSRALEEAEVRRARKQAEENLKMSESRLRDIIFSMADWVWEVDANGVYVYSSEKGAELLDTSRFDIVGHTPFDFMPPGEAERIKPLFADIVAHKRPIVDLENWNIGRDGGLICLLTNGVPILDENGNLAGYRGVDKDITEKKLAEEALTKSEAKLNLAQEIARMGSWEINLETGEITMSKNLRLLLGFPSGDTVISFKVFLDLVHPDDRALFDINLEKIRETKGPVNFDFRYQLADSRILWVQNNVTPVFKNGQLTELHGTNIDITEKKQIEFDLIMAREKAVKSDELKSAFINNISHEVRTPLNGIIGFSEILVNQETTPEKKKQFLDIIKKSSNRLLKTITDYMDISMIVSGNMTISVRPFSLREFFDDLYAVFSPAFSEKGLRLSCEYIADLKGVMIETDHEVLQKIFTHLIDNALKFTQRGKVVYGMRFSQGIPEFFVRDTGIGIEKEKIEEVIRIFTQADSAITRGYEGSGLGLSIADGLAKLLNSCLAIQSEPGKGTEISFKLPALAIRMPDHYKAERPENVEIKEGLLVLVAEDDEFSYQYLELVLVRNGFKVLRAVNGIEAVKKVSENSEISLVLMDIKMPLMGGIEATEKIRSVDKELPIVALTAFVSAADELRALKAGCNEFVPKPISRQRLLNTIKRLIPQA